MTTAGIGGDAFALCYDAKSREVSAFMANGQSPARLTLEVSWVSCAAACTRAAVKVAESARYA